MVWAILIFLGVPLWICAAGITVTVLKNRGLQERPGDIPVRVKPPGKTRWARGHAIWVSDVFAWRKSPASWNEGLVHVTGVKLRSPSDEERHKLRRLGDNVQIATLSSADGRLLEVAAAHEESTALVGPFVAELISASPSGAPQPIEVHRSSTERS